jgi:hypothetical protein
MEEATAQALADGYLAFGTTGDLSLPHMFSPGFHDNVSGQRGWAIFPLIARRLEESFADRTARSSNTGPCGTPPRCSTPFGRSRR